MAHVKVSNSRGEIVAVPAHWVDHPVLGKGFRRIPSRRNVAPKPASNNVLEEIFRPAE